MGQRGGRLLRQLAARVQRREAGGVAGRLPRPGGLRLWDSLHAVDYLRDHEPDRVASAFATYRCFEPYREDPRAHALATRALPDNCEPDVVRLLAELRPTTEPDSLPGLDPAFVAWQNAEVLAGAERYYREMVRGDHRSWNVRDHHMVDTFDRLMAPTARARRQSRGRRDARATDMAAAGMVNVGQLVRERHGAGDTVLVGFGTYQGTVIASDVWGGPGAPDAGARRAADSIESPGA